MLPKPIPDITGEDAKNFLEEDAKPLPRRQKAYIKHCKEVYETLKPK